LLITANECSGFDCVADSACHFVEVRLDDVMDGSGVADGVGVASGAEVILRAWEAKGSGDGEREGRVPVLWFSGGDSGDDLVAPGFEFDFVGVSEAAAVAVGDERALRDREAFDVDGEGTHLTSRG